MEETAIKQAYDSINPTQEQKDRMRKKILASQASGHDEERQFKSGYAEGRKLPVFASAAMLILVLGIAMVSIGLGRDGHQAQPGASEGPNFWSEQDHNTLGFDNQCVLVDMSTLDPILDRYRAAIREDWSTAECEAAGISPLCSSLASTDSIGYAIMELNGDIVLDGERGTLELVIGDGEVIYDLYVVDGGEFHRVFSSTEHNTYALCKGNIIRNNASNGAENPSYRYYHLVGTELMFIESMLCVEEEDGDICWYAASMQVSATSFPVDEVTALSVIGGYPVVSIEMLPLE